jgi:protein TonB
MFAETLLESSTGRKRKRWPMATAFTVQTIVAAFVVIVPLLSTGVIPLSARMTRPKYMPLTETPLEKVKPPTGSTTRSGPASASSQMAVVLVNDNPNKINFGPARETTTDPSEAKPGNPNIGRRDGIPDLGQGNNGPDVKLLPKRIPISTLSEAYLTKRVEPIYPRVAIASGIQGQVKLHAVIARNGKIESLEVISGPALLVQAALDAVRQWQYRPYYLNGEAVEVETFITVNFRRENR